MAADDGMVSRTTSEPAWRTAGCRPTMSLLRPWRAGRGRYRSSVVEMEREINRLAPGGDAGASSASSCNSIPLPIWRGRRPTRAVMTGLVDDHSRHLAETLTPPPATGTADLFGDQPAPLPRFPGGDATRLHASAVVAALSGRAFANVTYRHLSPVRFGPFLM